MIDTSKKISGVNVNGTAMEIDKNLTTKSITENGTYYAIDDGYDGYDTIEVDVSGGSSPTLVTKTITQNGTYNASNDSADGYSSVTVNVPDKFQYYVNAMTGASTGVFQDNIDLTDDQYAYLMNGVTVDALINFFTGSGVINAPYFDTSRVTDAQNAFAYSTVETLPSYNFSNLIDASYMFEDCYGLTVIPAYDFSNLENAADMFAGCTALEEINITGIRVDFDISASVEFTASALADIISNLGDVANDGNPATGVNTATLTMGATNLAKLSQQDIDDANAKGWTLT